MSVDGWKKMLFSELCEYTTGKLNSNQAETDGKFPFFTCSPEVLKINKYAFDQDAVLLAGNNANGIFHLKRYKGKFNAYQRTYVINSKNSDIVNNKFIYYQLSLKLNMLKEVSLGTATRFLTKTILDKIVFDIPRKSQMIFIADTLSCIDDKIELNKRINKTLEEMAQAIFKSWFVDFEPFQDGEFEDSELGRIPKGWRAGCIEDIAKQVSNVIRRDDIKDGSRYIGLEHIPRKQMILDQFGSIEEVTSNKLQFEKYNVILGKIRPYFHKVSIAPWDGYCSTDAIVLAPKMNDSFSYMFLTAFSDSFVRYAVQISHGTKMPRAEWKALKEYRVVLPPTPVMTSFNQIVLPIIDKMVFDCCENNKLKKTRDTLLPKLMSGEIRVPIEEVQ